MSLPPPPDPPSPTPRGRAVRLLAAVTTVVVVVLLGSIGTSDSVRPTYHHYVAMGDSYTAAPFVPLTDVAYGCFRSSNNYPKLVAEALRVEEIGLYGRRATGAKYLINPNKGIAL